MIWSLILLSIPLVTIVYYLSHFTVAILLRVSNKHYFLGFGGAFFEFKVRGTTFTVGCFIPFFGLSKVSKVENFMRSRPDSPWQFFHRPWLIRAIATYGGAIGVLLLGIVVMTTTTFVNGEQFISRDELNKYGVYPSALAETFGFRKADRILAINGQEVERYEELQDPAVYQTVGGIFLIERNREKVIIRVPEGDHHLPSGQAFLEIMIPPQIESIVEGSPAEVIGLEEGDKILSVNARPIDRIDDMRQEFLADDDGTVDLRVQRLQGPDTIVLQHDGVKLNGGRGLGIFTSNPLGYSVKRISFTEAVEKGLAINFQLLRFQFYATFSGLRSENRGGKGPINISAAFGDDRYWEYFWYFTTSFASLCVVWNILPYPRSAFWEVIALVFEGITTKKYSYALFRSSLKLAWVIFWGMLLFSLVTDLMKLF